MKKERIKFKKQNINFTCDQKTFLFILLVLTVISYDVIMRKFTYEKSLELIKFCFKNIKLKYLMLFKNFSLLTEETLITFLFLIYFLFNPVYLSYKLSKVYFLQRCLGGLLKIIIAAPRPFWGSREIYLKCHSGYGSPSAHSFTAACFYLPIWYTNKKKFKDFPLLQTLSSLLTFSLIFLVGLSRFVLAVHSIDQIISGYVFGLLFFVYFYLVSYEKEDFWTGNEVRSKRKNQKNRMIFEAGIRKILALILSLFTCYFVFVCFDDKEMEMLSIRYGNEYGCKSMVNKSPGSKGFAVSLYICGYFSVKFGVLFKEWVMNNWGEGKLITSFIHSQQNTKLPIFFALCVFWYISFYKLFYFRYSYELNIVLWTTVIPFLCFGVLGLVKELLYKSAENEDFGNEHVIKIPYDSSIRNKDDNCNDEDDESANLI